MHSRVEKLPEPSPDYRRFLQAVGREKPARVPLIELAIHPSVVNALLDDADAAPDDRQSITRRAVRLQHRLGYDVVKISAPIPWDVQRLTASGTDGDRAWVNEHGGPIAGLEDLDRFPWPEAADIDFAPVDAAIDELPDGMALLGFSGGVLEFSMDLIGMEQLFVATRRNPELVAAVVDRVGRTIHTVFEAYCQFDAVCALWLGDDLGHKHGTLLSPIWLSEHIIPWYARFAELAHRHGRPFLLHSCGKTEAIMPAIVDAGIDAKHSFEDGILPVEQFHDEWHEKIGVLGGVDVHLLSVGDEAAIRKRTLEILEHLAPKGGYAAGSGNSIPDYVLPEHFLAMIEAVADFNGRA
jgi:uroporphyrinogen decarboxylase